MKYTPIHVHTTYSFLDGYGTPQQICDHLKEIGLDTCSITDHGNTWGHIEFYTTMVKNKMKPLLGCEFYWCDDLHVKSGMTYHMTIIAKNNTGLRNLYKLQSIAGIEGFYRKPRIDLEHLFKYHEGLIVTTGCLGAGYLSEHYRDFDTCLKFVRCLKDKFLDDMYVEVTPYYQQEQQEKIRTIVDLAVMAKAKLVATLDSHYPKKEDAKWQEIKLCINTHSKMNNPNRMVMYDDMYIWSGDEMEKRCRDKLGSKWREAIRSTNEIAKKCNVTIQKGTSIKFVYPKGTKSKLKHFKNECWAGFKRRSLPLNKEYKARMKRELSIINEKGFVDYFLVIADMCVWAKKRMLVGSARGSSAGSLVCYCLSITEVDPIKHGLFFERFIDITRPDLPDIDVDFPDNKRHLVFKYMRDKYGRDKTASIGAVSYFKPKVALQDIGRIYHIPNQHVKDLGNLIIERSSGDARVSMCLQDSIEMFDKAKKIVDEYPQLKFSENLEGQIRQSTVHACGLIVSGKDLTKFGSFSLTKEGDEMLCVDKHGIKKLDLLKIDILGLKLLAIFEDCLELIGKDYEWLYNVPLDDPKPYKVLMDQRFSGVFQWEGEAVQIVSNQTRPDEFRNLSEISALARPGALHCGGTTMYLDYRAHEKGFKRKTAKKAVYIHPLLEEIASETHGVIVYQEQVLMIMKYIGAMSWSDTMTARIGMSKSMGDEYFGKLKEGFIKGALKNGMEEDIADTLWNMMNTFGSWAFNKSHSVSYGIMSYWCLYLKYYYPAEYYTAVLAHESDDGKIKKVLREWVEYGGKYDVLNINDSQKTFSLKDGKIIGGFSNVKGIGARMANKILDMRPFQNKDIYTQKVPKKIQQILAVLDCLPTFNSGQADLFSTNDNSSMPADKVASNLERIDVVPWDDLYPIGDGYKDLMKQYDCKLIRDVDELSGPIKMVAKIIAINLRDIFEAGKKNTTYTKRLDLTEFCILTIEDDTGLMMASINRFTWPKYRSNILENGKGAVVAINGNKIPSFRKIDVKKITILT